jgi:hypothetical protein
VHGSATAIMGPVMSATISDIAPPDRRATWLSLLLHDPRHRPGHWSRRRRHSDRSWSARSAIHPVRPHRACCASSYLRDALAPAVTGVTSRAWLDTLCDRHCRSRSRATHLGCQHRPRVLFRHQRHVERVSAAVRR